MMMRHDEFSELLAKLCESYPEHLEFPLGDGLPIPTSIEKEVISAIQRAMPLSHEAVANARRIISLRSSYALATFAVRTAILAARTHTPELLDISAVCLAVDDCQVDWRDVLVALSLFEACVNEIGDDLDKALTNAVGVASPQRRAVIEDYLDRSKEMRDVEVMGFKALKDGRTFGFVHSNQSL